MDARLLFAVALVHGLSAAHKEVSVCLRANARSCEECIRASETCGWCSHESFLKYGESRSARCDDLQSLSARQCPPENIENPRGSISVIKNLALTDRERYSHERQVTQIQPQKISLTLRSGEAQTFSLKFKRAEDYPIDLYYLMDLSFSMKDDLENVKNLGTRLIMEMLKITSDFRIGFGLMVKSSDARSCPENQTCSSPFTFKNLQRLSQNLDQVHRELGLQQVSELDSPDGGLHALRQAALCEEQIGWRNGLRILVVVTKGKFQFVRDGPIQTGLCQLQTNGFNHDGQISSSLSDLADVLTRQNIQTVFLVSENHLPVYQELTNNIPKSTARTLSNSSSVFELITEAYGSLSSEVILENSGLPEGVTISYKSLCKNRVEGTGENGRKCSNISIGDEVSFEISVSSQQCPEHGRPEVVKIKPLGFNEEVEVELNFICECQCSAQAIPHSSMCFGHGSFQCGACKCDDGRMGSRCECSSDSYAMDANCRKDNGTDICSNNGDCVCGTCECKKRENPNEVYSGAYCECDNFNCDRSNNKLCGGHGRCECRVCICDANYTGSACDCSLDQTSCLAKNGQICNGRGTCECGVCKCTDPKFQGRTCEICPTCPGVCSEHKACVQCRAFGTGQKAQLCEADCSYLTMTKVASVENLPQPTDQSFPLSHCRERDEDDCWFYFTYSLQNGAHHVTAVQKRDCPSVSYWDMVLPPNIRRLV